MGHSTLDPVLRMEQKGLSWQGFALLGSVLTYLLVRPGELSFPYVLEVGPWWYDGNNLHVGAIYLQSQNLARQYAGVLQGAVDYYILDKLNRLTNTPYTKVCTRQSPRNTQYLMQPSLAQCVVCIAER